MATSAELRLSDWCVRPAGLRDLDGLKALAELTGGGFTNLPNDRDALSERIARSDASYAARLTEPKDENYILVLEHAPSGRIGGTCCLFSRVGVRWPFYSYKLTTLSMQSAELGRTFRTGVLHLVNDFEGASEVGGLFLHPDLRTGGLGRLLARSRYLFLGLHRARFGDRVLAELRGRMRDDGSSPFWDGLAGKFFGMGFQEADAFNAVQGNQFIADLMPKYPVYVAMLPAEAQEALGHPHDHGQAAKRLLEAEGFGFHGYVDIFDGGPTMDTRLADIRTVREAVPARVAGVAADGETRLVAGGQLKDFRCAAIPARESDAGLLLGKDAPFSAGDEVLHAGF
ncbi:arginine N-succinyltransferase [Sandaracinobacter neustonicus]|uniref:Arginine N-succinyltransferase n=1 Tax=Sandaracinobacter neustonicus TaxID=1715348 RepID=A0A501XJV0_9SPHN|nr:arginine N-succinyltransferase [Sandaracinobacter neustonicus]TPE60573.1 arginine N-succinyltransferase [Sandaracinobacter neustonicus]